MPLSPTFSTAGLRAELPAVNTITTDDLRQALHKGIDDFKAKPSHIIMLMVIYPIVGLFAGRIAAGYDMLPLIFPLMSGFALVGPVAALGLYQISRRREEGRPYEWRDSLGIFAKPTIGAIATLAVFLGIIYFVWLASAMVIHWMTFGGLAPTSLAQFATDVFTTSAGWTLIIAGTAVGFVFAVIVLAVAATSFPMLLERNVSATTAALTSVAVFRRNPKVMLTWGGIVAAGLILGSIPLFVGLAITMPVLGHATWHLYRAAVPR
ncbi:DUF2189 domain-containing protein [Breoghania sp. L-A4]|uniref:DUF2189 domain-containing protein n=1 Tax=Breoghania sp. L-A4 TaxID=2304600 RepID=UPI000E35A340|nr:DUF2189 domain-containing protein [Breoghania sp. L-A4]AXS41380.1 DUF2189 domain-containing protein [Breoghania sp. L-A4]